MSYRQLTARERLIVALDVPDRATALGLADLLRGHAGVFKVGLELFAAEGPALVRRLVNQGDRVFLDLKFHDIPNTVRAATREAAKLGIFMLDIHVLGGRQMMQAALEGARGGSGSHPLVLGVTILTSLAKAGLAEVGIAAGPEASVTRLARLAREGGLDGVVASPREATAIRGACGTEFIVVTPGIRPGNAANEDQARAATPAEAMEAGADFLVVGRPITRAVDPVSAAEAIVAEMDAASVSASARPGASRR